MPQTREFVEQALDRAVETIEMTGVVRALRGLTRDVWTRCLDRYEPDELGDTHMSLGIQASENLQERACRRWVGDDREAPENHWTIDGLRVSTPRKVLTVEIGDLRILTMKTPMAEGRSPNFDLLADWEHQSHARQDAASDNTKALGGYCSPASGQGELFHSTPNPKRALIYMWLWSGELASPLTAGWLAVPVLGEAPFAHVRPLWHDDETDAPTPTSKRPSPGGPRFDERPVAGPELSLKPLRPGAGEA